MTNAQLMSLNGLRGSTIHPGQELKVRGTRAVSTYRVRRGDNLWEIAKRFRTSVSSLRKANDLPRKSVIKVGQKLKIPE